MDRIAHTPARPRAALVGVALALCLASAAEAVTLRYAAPDGCPAPAALRAAVSEALGGVDPPGTLVVEVAADRRSARIGLLGSDGRMLGRRTVTSPVADCAALVRAAGLSGGLALAPLAAPAPDPEPIVTAPASPPAAPPSPIAWGGAVGLGVALALQPGAALALDGGLRVSRGPWAGVFGIALAGAPAWADGEAGGGRVRSGRLVGALRACGARWGLEACLGALAGVEAHQGAAFARDRRSAGPWLAGSLRVEWRVFGRWGPRVEIVAPVGRVTLTVDGEPAWTTPAVGGALGLGAVF